MRRAALEQLGGFAEDLRFGEDVDLVWRLVEAGHRVRYDPRSVHYEVREMETEGRTWQGAGR